MGPLPDPLRLAARAHTLSGLLPEFRESRSTGATKKIPTKRHEKRLSGTQGRQGRRAQDAVILLDVCGNLRVGRAEPFARTCPRRNNPPDTQVSAAQERGRGLGGCWTEVTGLPGVGGVRRRLEAGPAGPVILGSRHRVGVQLGLLLRAPGGPLATPSAQLREAPGGLRDSAGSPPDQEGWKEEESWRGHLCPFSGAERRFEGKAPRLEKYKPRAQPAGRREASTPRGSSCLLRHSGLPGPPGLLFQ